MIVSGEPARQPTVYVGFQAAYPLAHYLRGFPGSLPASPVFTRAPDLPARKRPIDAGWRPADLNSRTLHPECAGSSSTSRNRKQVVHFPASRPRGNEALPAESPPAALRQSIPSAVSASTVPCTAGRTVKKHRRLNYRRRRPKTFHHTATTPAPNPAKNGHLWVPCPPAHYLRGFPACLPANALFTRAGGQPI